MNMGGQEVQGLTEKEKGLMNMDSSVVIAGGGAYKWVNGNGKIQ